MSVLYQMQVFNSWDLLETLTDCGSIGKAFAGLIQINVNFFCHLFLRARDNIEEVGQRMLEDHEPLRLELIHLVDLFVFKVALFHESQLDLWIGL